MVNDSVKRGCPSAQLLLPLLDNVDGDHHQCEWKWVTHHGGNDLGCFSQPAVIQKQSTGALRATFTSDHPVDPVLLVWKKFKFGRHNYLLLFTNDHQYHHHISLPRLYVGNDYFKPPPQKYSFELYHFFVSVTRNKMGISLIGQLIKKEVPGAVEPVDDDLTRFRGQRWVIEVSAFMHRFINKVPSVDNGEHLQCFMEMYHQLHNAGIHPCFVFDGKQTMAKRKENQKRAQQRDKRMSEAREKVLQVQQEIEQLDAPAAAVVVEGAATPVEGPLPEVIDFADMVRRATLRGQLAQETKKATRIVKREYYRALQDMFREANVPFVTARYEAEQACSWLARNGYADLVVSDDYDCLACDAPAFLQHFNSSLHSTRIVRLAPLLAHLRMTQEEFVDFCILCGTDFGGHLPGVGLARARKIITRHRRIETYLASGEGRKHRALVEAENFRYEVPRIMFTDTSFPLSGGTNHHLADDASYTPLWDRCRAEWSLDPPADRFAFAVKRSRETEEENEESDADAKEEKDEINAEMYGGSARKQRKRIIAV